MNETMQKFGESDEEMLSYLLTLWKTDSCHGDHGYKHFGKLGQRVSYGEMNFGILGEEVVFTANVLNLLIIGGFHVCRKREMKTGYRRGYRVSQSQDSFFRCEAIQFLARNCRPVDVVLSIDCGSDQFKSFEHL